ncbi:MAG: hypothetical protein ABIS18_07755, partial [Actinomycetota bacterium]
KSIIDCAALGPIGPLCPIHPPNFRCTPHRGLAITPSNELVDDDVLDGQSPIDRPVKCNVLVFDCGDEKICTNTFTSKNKEIGCLTWYQLSRKPRIPQRGMPR